MVVFGLLDCLCRDGDAKSVDCRGVSLELLQKFHVLFSLRVDLAWLHEHACVQNSVVFLAEVLFGYRQ